ncbi:hypothetical protein CYMTET_10421 [Cymbomonas tetramitiformis]|uniref:Uncharacterized protein n=1 Tax=Cymbomonas tetramitiformis TaxID=36881 RepID=A0AAE0LE15_9CHLO|nr:hypothetical protein CYMTET_10421 [Cymbomonas tetramitiformis]
MVAAGKFEGIALHAVISEPGGSDELLARLKARELEDLGFPLHSDPEFKTLLRLKDDPSKEAPLYIKKLMECEKFKSQTSVPYKNYTMVQPALVVYRKTGEIQQLWSWMTGPSKDVEPKVEQTKVPRILQDVIMNDRIIYAFK